MIRIIVALLMLSAGPALAQKSKCPADKPHEVTIGTGIYTCTLMGCFGRLVCDESKPPRCRRALENDCNTCVESVTAACIGDEELVRSRKP